MLAFHLQKSGQGCTQTERFRIGSVDAANHRLRHSFQRLRSQPATHKTRKALIVCSVCAFSWQKQIRGHACFSRDTENVATDKRPEPRRCEQLKPLGHRAQPAVSHDETASKLFVGLDESRFESESFGEVDSLRFFGDERIWSALD